tara:strand:+ start:306 stop:470 length:165 start_codon:yes stop_codon:yes gene_type:complete
VLAVVEAPRVHRGLEIVDRRLNSCVAVVPTDQQKHNHLRVRVTMQILRERFAGG